VKGEQPTINNQRKPQAVDSSTGQASTSPTNKESTNRKGEERKKPRPGKCPTPYLSDSVNSHAHTS